MGSVRVGTILQKFTQIHAILTDFCCSLSTWILSTTAFLLLMLGLSMNISQQRAKAARMALAGQVGKLKSSMVAARFERVQEEQKQEQKEKKQEQELCC